MRKLLFALPIVLLVAAGCNKQSPQRVGQLSPNQVKNSASSSTLTSNIAEITKPTEGKIYTNVDLGFSMLIPKDWSYKDQKIIYGYDAKANRIKLPLPEYLISFFSEGKGISVDLEVFNDNSNIDDSITENTFIKLSSLKSQDTMFDGEYHFTKISTIRIAGYNAIEYQDSMNLQEIKVWLRKDNTNYIFSSDDSILYFSVFRPYLSTVEFSK